MANKRRSLEKKAEELRQAGYVVRKRISWIKRTFQVEERLLDTFKAVQLRLGIEVKQAINEAIEDWVKKHGGSTNDDSNG